MATFWLTVLLPILGGALVIGFFNIIKRYIMQRTTVTPLQFLTLSFLVTAIVFAMCYYTLWGVTMPALLPGFWVAVFGTTIANVFIQFFNAKAASIDAGEVSLTAPLQAMTPGLITVLAILLGEYPGRIGIIGITLMALGSYVLLFKKTPEKWYHYLNPLRRLTLLFKLRQLSPEERGATIVVSLALASACMGTIGLIFDGLFTRRGINMQGLALGAMVEVGLLALAYMIWYAYKPDSKEIKNPEKKTIYPLLAYTTLGLLVLIGIFWVAHIFFVNPTYNNTLVAYVGTLKRLQILISVTLGFLFFKEKDFKKRIFAALLIVAGAILISMDDLPGRVSTEIQTWGF
ncbi:MAG: hypothetical protein Q8O83_04135 [bacterium]|nr:hypothetical protein [bacterium]